MSRGEVWWLEHPSLGRRPACILTRGAAIPVLRNLVVALATTTIRNIDTEVELGKRDGMPRDCALALDNVRTVPKALLTDPVTQLSAARMTEVCRALGIALGC